MRETIAAPDKEIIRFGNFFFQADVAHVVMLHAAGTKAGFIVNGVTSFSPWHFTDKFAAREDKPDA